MSVESISRVLNHSRAKGTAKLVLVGIANHDGDGGSWPSIATLCRYANVDRRTVQRAIADLVELGELVVYANDGGTRTTRNDQRPNRYEITVRTRSVDGAASVSPRGENGAASASERGGAGVANGAAPTPPEPSLNHQRTRGEGCVPESPARDVAAAPSPLTGLTAAAPARVRADRCQRHQVEEFPPPCGGCKDARLAVEAIEQGAAVAARAEAAARARGPRCEEHAQQVAATCSGCAADHKTGMHLGRPSRSCRWCVEVFGEVAS